MDSQWKSYGIPTIAILIGLWLLVLSLPNTWKTWAPDFWSPTLHLGLDLQGGTQLDFRISEAEMDKQIADLEAEIAKLEAINGDPGELADKRAQIANIHALRTNIVEAIRTVLAKRIDNMGVSEAVITPSYYGDEKHLLVECPGVIDVQECIATVGKTILLEFKEQFDGEDDEHAEKMLKMAKSALARITESGETLANVGADLAPTLGVFYSEKQQYFKEDLPEELSDLWNRTPEDVTILKEITPEDEENASPLEHGAMLVQVTEGKSEGQRPITDRSKAMQHIGENNDQFTYESVENIPVSDLPNSFLGENDEEPYTGQMIKTTTEDGKEAIVYFRSFEPAVEKIEASHILIAYEGAMRADENVTRTKKEAKALAEELYEDLRNGASFEETARTNSDGPSAEEGGSLGAFEKNVMTPSFEKAVWDIPEGEITEPVETEFGFHIIRKDADAAKTGGSASYDILVFNPLEKDTNPTEIPLTITELQYKILEQNGVTTPEEQITLQTLLFSYVPSGWKDTTLDGKHFRRASVTTDGLGMPVVQITFDDEGGKIFQDLTRENVNKPIAIFVGGDLVSAPTVQGEIAGGVAIITGSRTFDEANKLAQDLNTGAIPAPIHLVGQTTVEASLGDQALRESLNAALIGFLLVAIYMIWYYRLLGVVATMALLIYAVIFVALLKLPVFLFSDQYIVLSLAGIAGIILSIGMAVDANVLIFERMKEELRKGKLLETAADTGFKRAWSSIRDSNVSTLITAAILFQIGTSIVRGFAVTLSMGIVISLFSAIIVTRFLIMLLTRSPIAKNLAAFGAPSSSSSK